MYCIGIDIGGTFTDLVLIERDTGKEAYTKVPTRVADLAGVVMDGLKNLASEKGISVEDMLRNTFAFGHGTTIGTNAVATKQGVRVGLITTKGFEDTIYIQRATGRFAGLEELARLHQVTLRQPPPLVSHEFIKSVTERIDTFGEVVIPIDKDEVRRVVRELLAQKPDSIAICLLSSFVNDNHEQIVKEIVKEENPEISISVSSEIMPKIRENARMNTTIINAYIDPIVKSYISKLNDDLREKGCPVDIRIMNASGGSTSMNLLHSILTVGSGPTAGVMAAKYLGQQFGYKNIITIDAGGTTFDVSVIADGKEVMAEEYFGAKGVVDRYETLIPSVDVKSIGAGGGTIIWFDKTTNTIKVGPQSSGANPGPVFYDLGGTEPTMGDIYMALGYINPDYFLGGKIRANKDKAIAAVREKLANPMKMSVTEVLGGTFDLTNSIMVDAMRSRVVMKGHYPRDFVLFAYGGAGPMNSAFLGKMMGVQRLINLSRAAYFSAFGVAMSDTLHKYSLSRTLYEPFDVDVINGIFDSLVAKAEESMKKEGRSRADTEILFSMDMKYGGQVHEMTVPIGRKRWTDKDIHKVKETFMTEYEKKYGVGSAYEAGGVQIIALNVDAISTWKKPQLVAEEMVGEDSSEALKGLRSAYFRKYKGYVDTPVYDGLKIRNGNMIEGPAIVERPETTIVVPPDMVAKVDMFKDIIIDY